MSLELALAENTAALNALIAIFTAQASAAQTAAPEAAAAPKFPAPTPAPKQKAAPAPTAPTAEAAETAPAAKAEPQADPEPHATEAPPDYATTAKAVNDLVKARGRQAAIDVLASFGADTLKAVQPEQFAAVIAACTEAAQ